MSKMIFSPWTQNKTFRAAFPHTTELNCPQKKTKQNLKLDKKAL